MNKKSADKAPVSRHHSDFENGVLQMCRFESRIRYFGVKIDQLLYIDLEVQAWTA
jgi:hypothetical protein